MKIKFMLLAIIFLAFSGSVVAQPRLVERSFGLEAGERVFLNLRFGDQIVIKAWDEDRLTFNASVEINGGRLNDALLLDFEEDYDGLSISADFDEKKIKQGRYEDCIGPRYFQLGWHNDKYSGHTTICSTIQYEIMLPRSVDLKVETISSDIELFNLEGSIRAKSISGFIDLSWPGGKSAEFSMETISGEVYSGFDNLKLKNRNEGVPLVGYELRGSLGTGGPHISLESVSGNIFLRKGDGI